MSASSSRSVPSPCATVASSPRPSSRARVRCDPHHTPALEGGQRARGAEAGSQGGVLAHGPAGATIAKGRWGPARANPKSSARRCSSPLSSASEQRRSSSPGPGGRPRSRGSRARPTRTRGEELRHLVHELEQQVRTLQQGGPLVLVCGIQQGGPRVARAAPEVRGHHVRRHAVRGPSPGPLAEALEIGGVGRRSSASQRSTRSMFQRTQDRSSSREGWKRWYSGRDQKLSRTPSVKSSTSIRRAIRRMTSRARRCWLELPTTSLCTCTVIVAEVWAPCAGREGRRGA